MRWCLRFTRLLPDNTHRRLLVSYMRRLKTTMQNALVENLRQAGIITDEAKNPRNARKDNPIRTNVNVNWFSCLTLLPPETIVPTEEDVHTAAPKPANPESFCTQPAVCEALVVVSALVNSLLRGSVTLLGFVRRLILAFALHGYSMDAGYRLQVIQIRRTRNLSQRQRFWKDQLSREMLIANGGQHLPLDELNRTFGTVVHTMRFVCGNQRGMSWPSAMPNLLNRKHTIWHGGNKFQSLTFLSSSCLNGCILITGKQQKRNHEGDPKESITVLQSGTILISFCLLFAEKINCLSFLNETESGRLW